ncbi:hypothetical protein JHK87_000061 [Glycine soja]|nr:hypothetical protein JHK87_000061 [Glycine soja]
MCPLRGNSEESSSHLIPYVEKYLCILSSLGYIIHQLQQQSWFSVYQECLRPFHPHKHQNIEMRMQT